MSWNECWTLANFCGDEIQSQFKGSTLSTYTISHPLVHSLSCNINFEVTIHKQFCNRSQLSNAKKTRTQGSKTTIVKSNVKVATHVEDDYENMEHGWLSDKDEIDCPEAVAACLSPLKNGVLVMSSVSCFQFHLHVLIIIIRLKGLVHVKTEDSPKAICLYQQPPSQTVPQCQRTATDWLKAWTLENLPKGCNINETFNLIASLTYLQTLGHNKTPFGIPDDEDLSGMQAIFNHVYKALKSYTITIGYNCPVFRVVHYYHDKYDFFCAHCVIQFHSSTCNLCNILALAGCTIINSFFNTNIELHPDDVSHNGHATEVLATLSFLFRDPKNGTGLFCLDLIISMLSSYYGQIYGAIDVHDVHHSRYYCDKGPVGAIVLSLATVSPDVAYTHICWHLWWLGWVWLHPLG